MIPSDVLRKIRRIQIQTSHRVDEMLAGEWHSAFKGRGIEFEEVRPYQIGDDVRSIDWNVTARTGEPFVKLFREERELSVTLLVDLSASQGFGTQHQTKREVVTELGAVLAFSAIKNNDKIGLTLFTDEIEKTIPPRKGSRHVLRIIRELLYCQPVGRGTSLKMALEHLNRTKKRRGVVFLISDFQDAGFEKVLKIAASRQDIIPVVVGDRRESSIPNIGLVRLVDSESGQIITLDTASKRHRNVYERVRRAQASKRDELFRRLKLDPIHVFTGEDYVEPLKKYFAKREHRR